jgi:2-dehydro-3-deoxygalactonokinase
LAATRALSDYSGVRRCREFLSCDWGTSAFRLRWISWPDRAVLREILEPVGSKSLYDQCVALGDASRAGRDRLYSAYLRSKLDQLDCRPEEPLPLVISGMASSSVGWRELPYARLPFALDGTTAHVEPLAWEKPVWIADTRLVSGVAAAHDIMRGEETEALGLLSTPELTRCREGCLLVLPGTHSKHLFVRDQAVADFRTYMTGELFSVLTRHSLLSASTDPAVIGQELSHPARDAFSEELRVWK